MASEIERRWLVKSMRWDKIPTPERFRFMQQGYLEVPSPLQSVRIRIIEDTVARSTSAVQTVKTGTGISREEIEIPISLEMAQAMMSACSHRLNKIRWDIDGWEVDGYGDPLAGLYIAERELASVDEKVFLPDWLGDDVVEVTDTVTNLHLARLASDLGKSGQDPLPLVRHDGRSMPRRVVITGGPCSGKSSIMEILKAELPDTQFVPEVATIVIGQLGVHPGFNAVTNNRFQSTVVRVQKIFENTSVEFAASTGKKLVVLDRGTVDNAAYMPGRIPQLEQLLHTNIMAEYKRYDAVLFLATPPHAVYEANKGNNPARFENYDQAKDRGDAIRNVWRDHHNFTVIANGTGWDSKVQAVREELKKLLA